jgi:hypothetical protein
MKDINEVLRKKEADLQRLQKEVEALRIAARILSDETEAYARPSTSANSYSSPARPAPPSPAGASDGNYGASWDAATNKFP